MSSMLIALLLAVAPVCPPQKLQAARFAPGEILSFKLDALGADVGTFEVRSALPPQSEKAAALELSSRAKTSAFVSTNMGRYEAYASVLLSSGFDALRYREDVDEGDTHRGIEAQFPPAADGKLDVKATINGEPEPIALDANADVRDILSALFVLRAQPMKEGTPVCVEVFAGRKIWKVTGQVAARESIDTPMGRFPTMRIDAEAIRIDDVKVKRAAHVWVSDDARRLPLVALGDVRGKVIRATLVNASGMRSRVTQRK
jgi:hypothetical protein